MIDGSNLELAALAATLPRSVAKLIDSIESGTMYSAVGGSMSNVHLPVQGIELYSRDRGYRSPKE
jgi:hypothetical protein